MNSRATLLLLFVTLAVLGGLYILRQTVEPSRQAAEGRRYALTFDPESVREIGILRGKESISLHKEEAGWKITAPVVDRASPEAVDRLLLAVRFLEVHDRYPGREAEKFPESGLIPPRFHLELRGSRDLGLDLGAGTALPQEVFARITGERGVLRVADTLVDLADNPVDSFRDPRLTDLVADDIEKFTVRRADGEMSLRRERGRWMLDKPVRAKADPRAVRAFLEPLLGMQILSFGAQAKAVDPAAALPGQEASISLTPHGGGDDLELRVRGEGNGEKPQAAFFKPRGGDLTVNGAAAASLFSISPEALRDKSLGFVDLDTVDRIRLESDGTSVTLRREGEAWVGDSDGKPRRAEDVNKLVTAFNSAEVNAFRTAESVADTGLNSPEQKVFFESWLSENTPEESAGAHPIAGVELGKVAADGGIFARAAGSEETVTIPAGLFEAIRAVVFPGPEVNPRR